MKKGVAEEAGVGGRKLWWEKVAGRDKEERTLKGMKWKGSSVTGLEEYWGGGVENRIWK